MGGGGIDVQIHAQDAHVLDHHLGNQLGVSPIHCAIGRQLAGHHHVHPVAREDVTAAAGDFGDSDGVGAHALADQGRHGRPHTGAGKL